MKVKRERGRLVASDPGVQGKEGLKGLPGWATMSAQEAEQRSPKFGQGC